MSHDCIWAPKGIPSGVNVKIPYKGYEISIACDDSCGAMKDWSRTEIRVFVNEPGKDTFGMDVSNKFYLEGESMIYGYAENLLHVFKTIDSIEELEGILKSEVVGETSVLETASPSVEKTIGSFYKDIDR